MVNVQSANCSLLHRVQDLLRQKPSFYDVVFCVGPEKKEVQAVRILLAAASPVLQKKFELWDVTVVRRRSGRGILLPEFDPESFEIFVKLTMLDGWTFEGLKNLNLMPDQFLDLVAICTQFKMENALKSLKDLMDNFYSTFSDFKDTPDFLGLSHTNLQTILSSDSLKLNEVEIFECACRWAKSECGNRQLEVTAENLRLVLGDCLFEIRFPLMTPAEFLQCVDRYDILTPAEGYQVFRFISNNNNQKINSDVSNFPFKVKARETSVQPKINTGMKSKFATLQLTFDTRVVDCPPFVCDGSMKWNYIATKKKVLVHGVGFLGPVDGDANYSVTVQFVRVKTGKVSQMEKVEKSIFALKGKIFHVMFDQPFLLAEGSMDTWTDYYSMQYNLKGPNTKSFQRIFGKNETKHDGGNEFRFQWTNNQLAELLYSNV